MLRIFPLVAVAAVLGACLGQAPQEAERRATHPDLPGLELSGRFRGDGGLHRVDARAHNGGSLTFRFRGGCDTPWSERFTDPGGADLMAREPTVRCLGFAWEELPPGDAREAAFAWNGTRWDADRHGYVRTDPGRYTWQISFQAYSADADDPHVLRASWNVDVP